MKDNKEQEQTMKQKEREGIMREKEDQEEMIKEMNRKKW